MNVKGEVNGKLMFLLLFASAVLEDLIMLLLAKTKAMVLVQYKILRERVPGWGRDRWLLSQGD